MALAIDVGALSAQLDGLTADSLATAIADPTAELVKIILHAVAVRFAELDAEKYTLSISLESAVRSAEARCDQFKATADGALQDLDELRQRQQTEGTGICGLLPSLRPLAWSGRADGFPRQKTQDRPCIAN